MRITQIAFALALVGCGPSQPPPEPLPDPSAAAQIGQAQHLPNTLPPPGAGPRYVGRWSATADGCDAPAWIFEAARMHTAGEVGCAFNAVTATPGGYQIAATCSAEEDTQPYQLQVTFAESARAMMIAGGPWQAPTSLVYCGPLLSP